ncbi:hypothetical protein A9K55_004521 [Cordyceps militaris]|uniref:Uncharacterized protein n=1 Tax=Cordyceps militaris TaxID=73501 RepID=A0A2H4SM60_CORMI|nr:hypothetical protein A9K55_004521 [Cordyceps militaris]
MADVDADNFLEHRQPPVTPDSRRRQSHDEAGESSSAGSRRGGTSGSSQSAAPDLTRERLLLHQSRLAEEQVDGPARQETMRRKRRERPTGSFLLDGRAVKRSQSSRLPKPTIAAPHTRTTRATTDSLSNTPESAASIALRDKTMRVASDPFAGKPLTPSPDAAHNLSTGSLYQSSPASSQNSHAPAAVDADSTQIVNMALNLSESRRLASRRNVSRGVPPKLLPLPDSATSNDLRQQLKQQRRSSRNISPRPGQSMIPRQSTGLSASSPLHANFPSAQDDIHRYHFSASTLARAQKAKDQLELMSQYRRLLDVLPLLKPPQVRTVTTSPPASPAGGAKAFTWSSTPQLGRKYNPLQYIRNRKVRARERKVIDGERQGFAAVDSVKSWVEKCEQNMALQQPEDEAQCMVPFFAAEESATQYVPDPVAKAARNRRPRVDWFVEPCDMIADAYWIEQDRNKELIEDRHWRKIFPPTELSRPMSRENEEPRHVVPFSPDPVNRNPNTGDKHHIHRNHGPDHDRQHTIERAREKLHHMKDPNHWHVSDHIHARPRSKKDSASEYSESDNEARNRTIRDSRRRAGHKDAQPGDILHKQMLEMIAKENGGKDVLELPGVEQFVPPSMTSPERNVRSKSGSHLPSSRESITDTGDFEPKGTFERMYKTSPSPFRRDDQVVDGPHLRAPKSIDNDSSLPTSPELRPSRKATLESVTLELPAPWSRSGSPSKTDAAKIYTTPEAKLGTDRDASAGNNRADTLPRDAVGRMPLLDEEPSLARNASAPLAGDTIKVHRRMGSLLQRTDDPTSGLRGIFKGPRIDTVLRGGVSRIGDILRKKDGSESQELDSTDESDSERNRGRRRPSTPLSRRPSNKAQQNKQEQKHFLGVMPQFQHAPGASNTTGIHKSASWTGRGIQSNESSRVDLLQPPQTGLRSPSMSTSPPPRAAGRPGESDVSEPESTKGRVPAGVRESDRRLNAILGGSAARRVNRGERTMSRQWSIADQGSRQVEQSQLSRREMARVKTLVLSSGIKAMEINRRAQETHKPFGNDGPKLANIDWDGIAALCPETTLYDQVVPLVDVYPLAAQTLTSHMQRAGQRWQTAADRFTSHTGPALHRRVGAVRSRVADDLAPLTRAAVEEADEASRSLALDQPLRIKHVVDTIEKMLRRRRRRLRWLRRGLWLSVEWLVVGFMWYVWFVVMILRVFLGIGKGIWTGVKWVLWLA